MNRATAIPAGRRLTVGAVMRQAWRHAAEHIRRPANRLTRRSTRTTVDIGPMPQRFGNSYRWPDGSWTDSGA